jgi:transposase InsO family protein
MRSSMSRKGDCWDNAVTQSLWGSLKVARLHGRRFETRRHAMDEVIDWLSFYNHRRLHSTLGYVSPMQFERAWLAAQEKSEPHDASAMGSGSRGQAQFIACLLASH